MHHLCKQTRLTGLVALYIVAVLTLVSPTSPAADGSPPNGVSLEEVSFVCRERYRPEWASRPLATNSPVTEPLPPTPSTLAIRLLTEGESLVELQIPVALLRALQSSGRKSSSVELQVPAALLMILQSEGRVKLP